MSEDISKSTLLVLVILTIIISLLGTATVISEASKTQSVHTAGRVTLDTQQAETRHTGVSGRVVLTIAQEEDS